jgi:hypothetical protein
MINNLVSGTFYGQLFTDTSGSIKLEFDINNPNFKLNIPVGSTVTYKKVSYNCTFTSQSSTFTWNGFTYNWTLTNNVTPGYQDLNITNPLTCFGEDTKILTKINGIKKYIGIKELKPGDLVKTYKSGYKKIKLIGSKPITNNPKSKEYSLYKMESTGLVLTGAHSILVDNLDISFHIGMIEDKYLLNIMYSDKFKQITEPIQMQIYHLVLESDNINKRYGIYANGILAETTFEKDFFKHFKKDYYKKLIK